MLLKILFASGLVLLIAAIAVLIELLGSIGAREFHAIPKHAREGNRLARWYLRLIWGGFAVFGIAFLLSLGRG